MPAAKKHPSTRARRNTAPTAATLSRTSSSRAVPALPDDLLAEGEVWHPRVVAWWADLWRAPMADEYHESDVHQLYVLASLYQAYYLEGRPMARKEIAGEIRLQRQAFGLTPYDRRRLEWTIETAETAKERGRERRSRPAAPTPSATDDPRSALRLA